MSAIAVSKAFETEIADMKRNEHPQMTQERLDEARQLGEKLARLRMARRIRQADAATRAGLSRPPPSCSRRGTSAAPRLRSCGTWKPLRPVSACCRC